MADCDWCINVVTVTPCVSVTHGKHGIYHFMYVNTKYTVCGLYCVFTKSKKMEEKQLICKVEKVVSGVYIRRRNKYEVFIVVRNLKTTEINSHFILICGGVVSYSY